MTTKYKFICECGKCTFSMNYVDSGVDSDYGPYIHNLPRAGTFVHISYPETRVLLVQSYNGKWGPPKGKVEKGETSMECAVRETYEETGLNIANSIKNSRFRSLNNKWDIYNIKLHKQFSISPHSEEITGFGWFTLPCILKNKSILNHPCKLSLKEFLCIKM